MCCIQGTFLTKIKSAPRFWEALLRMTLLDNVIPGPDTPRLSLTVTLCKSFNHRLHDYHFLELVTPQVKTLEHRPAISSIRRCQIFRCRSIRVRIRCRSG